VQLAANYTPDASYELFKTIMTSENLADQDWEAARLAIRGAFEQEVRWLLPIVEEPRDILKFLDYHLGLHGAGEGHESSIVLALAPILGRPHDPPIFGRLHDPPIAERPYEPPIFGRPYKLPIFRNSSEPSIFERPSGPPFAKGR
jgi:hypothetical protein